MGKRVKGSGFKSSGELGRKYQITFVVVIRGFYSFGGGV